MRRLALILSVAAGLVGFARLRPLDAGPEGKLPPARHEERDVGFRPMLMAGFGMLLALCAVAGIAAWFFPDSRQDRTIDLPLAPFPTPQLQPNPAADMAAFRKRQLEQLNSAGQIDGNPPRSRMPIAEAMREVAERGIPDWPGR